MVSTRCATRVSDKKCPRTYKSAHGLSHKNVLAGCLTSALLEDPRRVSQRNVPQKLPTKVSRKNGLQKWPTRVSSKGVVQKNVQQECLTRASSKSLPQECSTRVSYKGVLARIVFYKSVPQDGPTWSCKSFPKSVCLLQEYSARVSHMCVCVTLCSKEFLFCSNRRGPGRMHRRLVNEAGDASEDMEMGRHFHVPAKNCCLRCDSTFPFLFPWWFFA